MLYCAVQLRDGSHAGPSRPGIQRRQLNAPPFFVRLASVEGRSFEFDAIDDEPRRDHAEAGMGRILQVMAERSQRQFRLPKRGEYM